MATGLPTQKKRTRRAGSDSWQLPWIKAVRGTTDDCYDCPECGLDRPIGREISVATKSRHLKTISSVIVISVTSLWNLGSRHSRSHGFKQLESRQMPWQKRERLVILIYERTQRMLCHCYRNSPFNSIMKRSQDQAYLFKPGAHVAHVARCAHGGCLPFLYAFQKPWRLPSWQLSTRCRRPRNNYNVNCKTNNQKLSSQSLWVTNPLYGRIGMFLSWLGTVVTSELNWLPLKSIIILSNHILISIVLHYLICFIQPPWWIVLAGSFWRPAQPMS